jgi:ketosteroid isomerase-like protein
MPRVGEVQRRSSGTTTPVPPVDVDVLREEIRKTYAAVSQEPEREFIFPTGRSWAEGLDYPAELANVPESSVMGRSACNTRGVIDQLRAAAEALNRGDPEPFASLFADDAEWRGISHGFLWWKRTPT